MPLVPWRSQIASSSASDSAPEPSASSLSRGRSAGGQSRMCMREVWRDGGARGPVANCAGSGIIGA